MYKKRRYRSNGVDGETIIIVLLILNFILSGCIIYYLYTNKTATPAPAAVVRTDESTGAPEVQQTETTPYPYPEGFEQKERYTIYVTGFNMPLNRAHDAVNAICSANSGGYEYFDGTSVLVDNTGKSISSNMLKYTFYGMNYEQLKVIMSEILHQLNINSILVEDETPVIIYYEG